MRKDQATTPRVSLLMVVSTNGIAAQKEIQNSFEWNSPEDREQFLAKINSVGTVLMGSNTYRSIGQKPYPGINFYVMTRQPERYTAHEQVRFVQGDVGQILQEMALAGIEHVALLGGPKISTQCFANQLVDDIYLTIEPLMMPSGMHIVADLPKPVKVQLESVRPLNQRNTLLLHYRVLHE